MQHFHVEFCYLYDKRFITDTEVIDFFFLNQSEINKIIKSKHITKNYRHGCTVQAYVIFIVLS